MKRVNFLSKQPFSLGSNPITEAQWKQNGSTMKAQWLRFVSVLVLIFTFGIGQMWAEKITINKAALTHLGSGYDNGAVKTDDIDNVTFTYSYLMYSNNNIQAQATNGNIYNSTLIPGKITNVAITHTGTGRSTTIYMGTSSSSITTQAATGSGSVSGDAPANTCPGYFKITRGGNAAQWTKIEVTYTPATITLSENSITNLDYNVGSVASDAQTFTVSGSNIPANLTVTAPSNFEVSLNGSSWASTQTINVTLSGSANAGTLSSKTVYVRLALGKSAGNYNGNVSIAMAGCNTITNVNPKTVAVSGTVTAAACNATPEIGAASLNGSFSLSSVGVQCASSGAGTNCSIAKYGFVWSTSVNTDANLRLNADLNAGKTNAVTAIINSGAPSGNSGSFTGNISSLTAGQTYYYRAFVINNGDNVKYSEEGGTIKSFTPYTVTFNMNGHGTAPDQQVVNTGGTASQPSNPSETGWTFGGWYTDNGTFNTTVNWSSTITANKNYYAKWTVQSFSLNWVTDGDALTGEYTNGTVNYGTSIVTPNTPTKTGYTFKAWSPSVAATMPASNTTYTATWTANTNTAYTVKHYKQQLDGTYSSTPDETQNLTGTTGASITPARKSYEGFTAPSGTTTTILADGSRVVEYQYTRNSYSLSWSANGGDDLTGSYSSGSKKYGEEITAPNEPTRTGYTFGGWHNGTSVVTSPSTMPAANTTYTAQWSVKSFNVTWMVNKHEWSGKGGSTSVNFNSRVAAVPSTNPDPKEDACGDRFMGWTTDEEYVHEESPLFTAAGDAPLIEAEGDVTYYAVFADYVEK